MIEMLKLLSSYKESFFKLKIIEKLFSEYVVMNKELVH